MAKIININVTEFDWDSDYIETISLRLPDSLKQFVLAVYSFLDFFYEPAWT